jgi:hypothetical protein
MQPEGDFDLLPPTEQGPARLCAAITEAAPSVAVFDGWEPRTLAQHGAKSQSPESHSGLYGYQTPSAKHF